MRVSIILLLAFMTPSISFGDTQLDFIIQDKGGKSKLSYLIQDNKIRIQEEKSRKVNVFDSKTQVYTSFDPDTGKQYQITDALITQKVERLNKDRHLRIQQAEQKLQQKISKLDPQQQEMTESLINQLKYPDLYGQQTQLEVHPTTTHKTVMDVACQVYNLKRFDNLIKTYCMADPKALGLSQPEYTSLRNFFRFNYSTQTRLLLARGDSGFEMIDYDEKNMPGVPIEIIDNKPDKPVTIQLLQGISHKKIHAKTFLQTGDK